VHLRFQGVSSRIENEQLFLHDFGWKPNLKSKVQGKHSLKPENEVSRQ
jgi:hypothetical protein